MQQKKRDGLDAARREREIIAGNGTDSDYQMLNMLELHREKIAKGEDPYIIEWKGYSEKRAKEIKAAVAEEKEVHMRDQIWYQFQLEA